MTNNDLPKIVYFFLKCSGSSVNLLLQCQESERNKHRLYGIIIFITSIFAYISSFYSFYKIFDLKVCAFLFAGIWAYFIFNIDRLIVSSMRKQGTDWKSRAKEFIQLLPRVALAIILAITISRPIEIFILEKKIERFMVESEEKNRNQLDLKLVETIRQIRNEYKLKRESVSSDILRLDHEIEEARKKEATALDNFTCEMYGSLNGVLCGSGRKGKGEIAKELESKYYELTKIRKEVEKKNRPEIESLKNLNSATLKKIDIEESAAVKKAEEDLISFKTKLNLSYAEKLAQYNSALTELTKIDEGAKFLHLFIALIFLVVELAPVTVKFLSHKRQYDYLLDEEDENAKSRMAFALQMNECLFEQFEMIKRGQKDISITHPTMRECLIRNLDKLFRDWGGDFTPISPSKFFPFSSIDVFFNIDKKYVTRMTLRLTSVLIILSIIAYSFFKIRGDQEPFKDAFSVLVVVLTTIAAILVVKEYRGLNMQYHDSKGAGYNEFGPKSEHKNKGMWKDWLVAYMLSLFLAFLFLFVMDYGGTLWG